MTIRRTPSPSNRANRLPLQDIAAWLRERFPTIQLAIDEAMNVEDGTSFLDVILGNHRIAVAWSKSHGFGVTSRPDVGYGEGPDETFAEVPTATKRITELLLSRTRTSAPPPQDLSELRQRLGVSQVQLAKRMKVVQGAISKLERRPDVRLSTVRAYLKALGAELEIQARFPHETIRLAHLVARPSAKARRSTHARRS